MTRKIFLFYQIDPESPDLSPELYAYTEDKYLAEFFMSTRSQKKFIMRKKQTDEIYVQIFHFHLLIFYLNISFFML